MSSAPSISIVLPTHNGRRYLDQSIESVVGQSCTDWELIVVDDASTDDTPARVREWAARDARIRAVLLSDNRKLPGALNEGFRHAAGEFWTWTSDDNWYHPNALARMREVLAAGPDLGVVYADSIWVDEQGAELRRFHTQPAEALSLGNCIGACFLYRRAVQQRLRGYDESLFLVEDYDFWLRASNLFRLQPLHEPLYYYRCHGGSLTARKAEHIARATAELLHRWLPQAAWLSPEARGQGYLRLAQCQFQLGRNGEGRKNVFRAAWASRRPLLFAGKRSLLVDLLLGPAIGNLFRSLKQGRNVPRSDHEGGQCC